MSEKEYSLKINYNLSKNKRNSFINPYNFINIDPQKLERNVTEKTKELHTGVLKCRLVTKTPLAIPDTERVAMETYDKKHSSYLFMKMKIDEQEKYVIPGSSIRGPIRSAYEAFTNSCLSTLKESQQITIRSQKPFKPGLLVRKNNKWRLYKAERIRYKANKNNKSIKGYGYGLRVPIDKKGDIVMNEYTDGAIEHGYLFIGERFSRKKYESVFVKKEEVIVDSDILDKRIKSLIETLKIYRNPKINKNLEKNKHFGYKHIDMDIFEKKDVIPIWYDNEGNNGKKLHLSFACIGRFAFNKTMNDVVGKMDSCSNMKVGELCPACSLFGMASKSGDEGGGLGSKVRFSDAICITENVSTEKKTLHALSSPKVSYLPFYINQNGDTIIDYDAVNASIRGRKYYWHYNPGDHSFENEKSNLNETMELIPEKTEFQFDVYYDNISEIQLNELKWVLCLGENKAKDENAKSIDAKAILDESNLYHKIGHGKPLGLGSVKIVIDEAVERTVYNSDYIISDDKKVEISDEVEYYHDKSSNSFKSAIKMHSFIDSDDVRYPHVIPENENVLELLRSYDKETNSLAAHQWFGHNYKFGNKDKTKVQLLPDALNEDVKLLVYEVTAKEVEKKDNGHGKKGNNWNKAKGKGKGYGKNPRRKY